jgi:hypothetical protein
MPLTVAPSEAILQSVPVVTYVTYLDNEHRHFTVND